MQILKIGQALSFTGSLAASLLFQPLKTWSSVDDTDSDRGVNVHYLLLDQEESTLGLCTSPLHSPGRSECRVLTCSKAFLQDICMIRLCCEVDGLLGPLGCEKNWRGCAKLRWTPAQLPTQIQFALHPKTHIEDWFRSSWHWKHVNAAHPNCWYLVSKTIFLWKHNVFFWWQAINILSFGSCQ